MRPFSLCAVLICTMSVLGGEHGALQTSLKDTGVQGPWYYNDLNAGYAEAAKTGKPLLVTFRCVP